MSDDATGSPASVYFSIPFSPPWPTLTVCKGFTLPTFAWTEWLEDGRGMDRMPLDGELSQLKRDVEEFDPWDLFPRPQYSHSCSRNSLVLQISKSSHMDHNRASHWDMTFVCPCIASVNVNDDQQDATILVYLLIPNQLYVFRAISSPIIRSMDEMELIPISFMTPAGSNIGGQHQKI